MELIEQMMRPYFDQLVADVGGSLDLVDAHTHIGQNDPDGFKQTPEQLLAGLARCDARGLVFPMHEPGGYREANDIAIAAAADSGGRLRALCRVDPKDGAPAVEEARRALDAGARGIKLHPRAEQFTMSHPAVRDLVALAHEREATMLIHAGRGIPALGADTVALSGEFTRAKLILAHAAVSDLAWLWRELPTRPNVYVDTAWWNPSDIIALLRLVPPGQVLWASDSPYGDPLASAVQALRCAIQVGLAPEQIRGIAGEQADRLLEGEEPLDLGPPVITEEPLDPLLERVVTHLASTIGRLFVGADHAETLGLSRLALDVGDDLEIAPVCRAVAELLDALEGGLTAPAAGAPFPPAAQLLVVAIFVARTPRASLP